MDEREDVTRREALRSFSFGAIALAAGCAGARAAASPTSTPTTTPTTPGASTMPTPRAFAGNHAVLPLPFAPGALPGLSERMISSHHENNYAGAVRNLNRVELELARVTADTPPFVVAALHERELAFRNSKTLHEAYFANLGGDGRRSGAIESALADAYGSSATWEQHARTTAMGLGGGSGWALLVFELDTGDLRTIASGNHTQALTTSVPLLVLDMYEHSYQMDFGAAVARYLDAFFANVRWDEVDRRLESARRARAMLTGGGA